MPFKSYRDESRNIDWGRIVYDKQQLSRDDLKFGTILRIADACELMAKNHQRLVDERDRYKKWWEEERKCSNKSRHQIAGLRGYIKRLKK